LERVARRRSTDTVTRLGLLALAGDLAANSVLGPFLADLIDCPVSETMRSQTIGLDAASLLVVVPSIVVVGYLALRGQRGARELSRHRRTQGGPSSVAQGGWPGILVGGDRIPV
jgi:hypothetical protein